MDKSATILITGATGQQGGALARDLLQKGYKVRAFTRSPEKAADLKQRGAEIAVGNFDDRASMEKALKGVQAAFLMGTPYEAGVEVEERQGLNFMDAVASSGLQYLVYTSVGSAHLKTGIPHFESKWHVEERIRSLGIAHCILRPVFFMDNISASWMLPALQSGKLVMPINPETPLQSVAVSDVGRISMDAFVNSDQYKGVEIDLAGDELTMPEFCRILSEAAGKTITYEAIPVEVAEPHVGRDFALMFRWFNEVGYSADIAALNKKYGMTNFRDFVKTSPLVKLI